jgi:hypothetical protein
MIPTSFVATASPATLGSPPCDEISMDQMEIKVESDSDEDMASVPDSLGGNPDPYWIQEWAPLDPKSRIASQVEFFNTCPRFNNAKPIYVLFYHAIQETILQAKAAPLTIATDPVARANLQSLRRYFEDFLVDARCLLRGNLERIKMSKYGHCQSVVDLENCLQDHADFLKQTEIMAFRLHIDKAWLNTSTLIHYCRKMVSLAKQRGPPDNLISSMQEAQPPTPSLLNGGPLSPELMRMNYEFTDAIWFEWIEGCTSYFEYWTADSTCKFPADDFLRHLSHYQLAMELSLKHKSVSDEKLSTLLMAAKEYMSQYRGYAAMILEIKYSTLKENVKNTDIYLTEAIFWHLADDLEVLINEAPPGIKAETWNDAVPAMLPQEKALAAKSAVNLLYKEFQIKRYPEDEGSYLWWLTWRNIKHLLPHMTSSLDLDAMRQDPEGLPITIEARDLALPFVEKNLSQLLTIVQKDNDALYQKAIESLVGDYCAHIDKYVQGKGDGQQRIYEQFARLSNTKRVPFIYLVRLEESLLKPEAKPNNASQMIAHRVVKRLNHIMEGPKMFKRWGFTNTGSVETYKPTSAWVKEQEAMRQSGFSLDDPEQAPSYSLSPSQAPGNGAGGGDDGDGDKKRDPFPRDNGWFSGSDEEFEVISPGGTKRVKKRKKGKRVGQFVTADTLTKAKLQQLGKLSRPDPDATGSESESKADDENKAGELVSGLHPLLDDSLEYHRRRLNALRVEQRSAVPNAQYPIPETAAPQRAAALQIARELADPGIFSVGPRAEDVQNYINPALRLPLTEEQTAAAQEGMSTQKADHLKCVE